MNKKQKVLIGVGSTAVFGLAALFVPLSVAAQSQSGASNFVSQLAAKLGIEQSKVETAVNAVHSDMESTRLADLKTELTTAVTAGKLTQRQADLLLAEIDAQQTVRAQNRPIIRTDLSTLTVAEREAKRTEEQSAMQKSLVDQLNTKGWKTTTEELTAARTAAETAGLRVGGRDGKGGPGMGMGMGMGRGL